MRVTLAHNRTKQEVIQSVDRSFDDLFQTPELQGIKLKGVSKTWQGSTLTFGLTAKMGLFSTPIKGTIEVTDTDITIDADLGMLERLIPANTARELLSARVRGLLN
jgi:Putative polyhydroxyalkanoic acid system protein (PHA_gran_rgn)